MELDSKNFLKNDLKCILYSGAIGLSLALIFLLVSPFISSPFPKRFTLTFIITLGFFLLLSWHGISFLRLLLTSTALAGCFSLLFAYQLPPPVASYGDGLLISFLPFFSIYIANTFHQVYHEEERFVFPYPQLFRYAWNTLFILMLSGLFTLLCWVVLWIWGYLFTIIGILFFKNLFSKPLFVTLAVPTFFSMGIAIIRKYERLINALRQITIAVFFGLLPILAVVGLAFIVGLIIKIGIFISTKTPILLTDNANFILLITAFLTILFLNAVFQDGEKKATLF